jgi:hypothetical protein
LQVTLRETARGEMTIVRWHVVLRDSERSEDSRLRNVERNPTAIKGEYVKAIELSKWPFRALVVLSLVFSALHGLLQLRWAVIRYRSFGQRPFAAQAYIGSEVLLLMVIFTVGMVRVSNRESPESRARYYMGIAAAVGAWIVVSFVI